MLSIPTEIRTRRLVIEDTEGRDRIIAEINGGVAELRLLLPQPSPHNQTAIVIFSAPDATDGCALGPGLGIQFWANGNAVMEIDAWPDEDGNWRPHLHFETSEESTEE